MNDLQLSARLTREGDTLVLEYRVSNQASRDAYLLNRVHEHSMRTSPDVIYIELDRGRRLVQAYKKVPAIPEGMSPTMPVTPYVTPLRAGTSLTETVRIPLPVREFSAYAPLPQNTRIVSYQGLQFALGFYWSVPGIRERQQEIVPGVEALILTTPPGVQVELGELSSDVMPFEIPVLESAS